MGRHFSLLLRRHKLALHFKESKACRVIFLCWRYGEQRCAPTPCLSQEVFFSDFSPPSLSMHLSSKQRRPLPGSFFLYNRRKCHLLEQYHHINLSMLPHHLLLNSHKAWQNSSRSCSKIPLAEPLSGPALDTCRLLHSPDYPETFTKHTASSLCPVVSRKQCIQITSLSDITYLE